MSNFIAAVDLAKDVIQVCCCQNQKVLSNTDMTPPQLHAFLTTSSPMTVIFESCATANYWYQTAQDLGHTAKLISSRLVARIRQNQKTDRNDALAIAQAGQMMDVRFIQGKTVRQQEYQSLVRLREQAVKQKVALRNQLEALLLEFNIRISRKSGGLGGTIQSVLEEADNGFCDALRRGLYTAWQLYSQTLDALKAYDMAIEEAVQQDDACKKLLSLESVGPINAINLYVALLGGEAETFTRGRDVAASIGLTPVQHSSGGKTQMGSISKHARHHTVRSYLISGAMSVVNQVNRRDARTGKEQWLKGVIARRGKRRAAVALANKTVRTAYAILRDGTQYKAQALVA